MPNGPKQITRSSTEIQMWKEIALAAEERGAIALLQMCGQQPLPLPAISPHPARDAAYYQKFHNEAPGYRTNNWLTDHLNEILAVKPKSILELGCGNGHFLRAAAPHAERIIGLDWAKSDLLNALPANVEFMQRDITADPLPKADVIASADVLEHLAPEAVHQVMTRLHEAGDKQYHVIACYDDGHSHLTVMSPAYWLALFRQHSSRHRIRDLQARPRNEKTARLVAVIANF